MLWEDPSSSYSGASDFLLEARGEDASQIIYGYVVHLHYDWKLTAKAVCVISYWAAQAGCQGKVATLAKRPSADSGKFQHHLDQVLGTKPKSAAMHRHHIHMPQHEKHFAARHSLRTAVVPPHESIAAEVLPGPSMFGKGFNSGEVL